MLSAVVGAMSSMRSQHALLALSLVLPLSACDGSDARPEGSGSADVSPEDLGDQGPDVDVDSPSAVAPIDIEPPVEPVSGLTARLVRRAELREAQVSATAAGQSPALAEQCAAEQAAHGVLDKNALVWTGGFTWFADAYVVTARVTGKVSVASEVHGINGAYEYGYGFPFNVQAVDTSAALPALSSVIAGMSLLDDALNDGKARVDLEVEAGQQYVIGFKQLVGPASKGDGWSYDLRFCAESLRVEGKLWVSNNRQDVVAPAPLSGPITLSSAPSGVMGQLASTLLTN
jgi:hypothetical protein